MRREKGKHLFFVNISHQERENYWNRDAKIYRALCYQYMETNQRGWLSHGVFPEYKYGSATR